MPQVYNIRVSVDPGAAPPPTAEDTRIKPPTTGVTERGTQLNAKNLANLAILGNGIVNVAKTTVGNVGAITGNENLQRQINRTVESLGYVTQIAISPIIGSVAVAAQLASRAIADQANVRNLNVQSQYLGTLRGNRTNGNR